MLNLLNQNMTKDDVICAWRSTVRNETDLNLYVSRNYLTCSQADLNQCKQIKKILIGVCPSLEQLTIRGNSFAGCWFCLFQAVSKGNKEGQLNGKVSVKKIKQFVLHHIADDDEPQSSAEIPQQPPPSHATEPDMNEGSNENGFSKETKARMDLLSTCTSLTALTAA